MTTPKLSPERLLIVKRGFDAYIAKKRAENPARIEAVLRERQEQKVAS